MRVAMVEREQAKFGRGGHARQPAAHADRFEGVLVKAGPGVVVAAHPDDVLSPHRLGDFDAAETTPAQVDAVDDAASAEQEREVSGSGHDETVSHPCIRCRGHRPTVHNAGAASAVHNAPHPSPGIRFLA